MCPYSKSMKNRIIIVLTSALLSIPAYAQMPQLNLPEDPALATEAKRRFAFSSDEMTLKRWRSAANSIHWLLTNTPKLYDGQYINAYKAYENLYNEEKDQGLKKIYLDSMFTAYQLKDSLFELTDREVNNMAYRYYKYYRSDKSKYTEMKAAFDRAFQKPETVINNNLIAYMDVYRRIFLGLKNISENEVLDIHGRVSTIISQKIENGKSNNEVEKWVKNQSIVDQMLTSAVSVDCSFIATKLYPDLEQNKDDLNLAKKILQLGLSGKCSSEDFFLEAAVIVNSAEPTASISNIIARSYASKERFDKAQQYFKQAAELETNPSATAGIYMDMAKSYASAGLKAQSRDAALMAMEKDSKLSSEVYSLIGNLYMASFDDCKKSKSQVDDRAVFLLAYDMYEKAGDKDGMNSAKEQFPTVGQVFELNKEEGQQLTVACWINRSTSIKTRKDN